jgi:hypothetical protein
LKGKKKKKVDDREGDTIAFPWSFTQNLQEFYTIHVNSHKENGKNIFW